jgi:NTP pyrophosphatase (non-canonical NTP hydrolase)
MVDLGRLQRDVGEWAKATFPNATEATILAHLYEELGELKRAAFDGSPSEVGEEAADVFLILLHLCERQGVLLEDAAARKFAVCRSRRFEMDPARGYARHVSPEPLPHHISRDLFPAQGADAEAEAVCGQILTASGESLREQQAPGVCWEIDGDVPRLVPLAWDAEVGCSVIEDAAERVLQAGERRRAAEEPPIEAGAGFAPGELARPVRGGVEEREE